LAQLKARSISLSDETKLTFAICADAAENMNRISIRRTSLYRSKIIIS